MAHSVDPFVLLHQEGTYPIVFEHRMRVKESSLSSTRRTPDVHPLADALRHRLGQRFGPVPELQAFARMEVESDERLYLRLCVLVDFPRRIEPDQRFVEWLFQGVTLYAGKGRRDREVAGLSGWKAGRPANEYHLCRTRLDWFIESERLTNSFEREVERAELRDMGVEVEVEESEDDYY
ncbi:hypothetical protein BJY04DRAFT_222525 [Aspergillus karnatakaensis]|uniref:uncharacterized protein n=1 Tax=Aspergillus karnatakaensis TaxID=1810916 RepID=UPI003CCDE766